MPQVPQGKAKIPPIDSRPINGTKFAQPREKPRGKRQPVEPDLGIKAHGHPWQRAAGGGGELLKGCLGGKSNHEPFHPAIVAWKEEMAVWMGEKSLGNNNEETNQLEGPRRDGVNSFWLKIFRRPAEILRGLLFRVMNALDWMLDWLVRGRTLMFKKGPKEGSRAD